MKTFVRGLFAASLLLSGPATAQQRGDAQQAKRKACREEAAMLYRGSQNAANNRGLGERRRAHVQQCMGR